MSEPKNTHGGPGRGGGRKPGQGTFAGGRPVSTATVRTGMNAIVRLETAGDFISQSCTVNVLSKQTIEFVAESGDKFVVLIDE